MKKAKIVVCFLGGNNSEIENHYFEKGYRDDVMIMLDDLFYEVYFFTPSSLEYEMTKDGYFSFPGIVILDEITTDKIKKAIIGLNDKEYFKKLKGEIELSQTRRFVNSWYNNELSIFDLEKLSFLNINPRQS